MRIDELELFVSGHGLGDASGSIEELLHRTERSSHRESPEEPRCTLEERRDRGGERPGLEDVEHVDPRRTGRGRGWAGVGRGGPAVTSRRPRG